MDLHRLRFALLQIAFPVLLATTWMFFAFVMDTRPAAGRRPASAIDRLARLPASLSTGKLPYEAKVNEPVRMETVQVPCWDRPTTREMVVGARWVRLVGKACAPDGEVTAVRNLTNGASATVLPGGRGLLTTDFIALLPGSNEISFSFGDRSESRITIVR